MTPRKPTEAHRRPIRPLAGPGRSPGNPGGSRYAGRRNRSEAEVGACTHRSEAEVGARTHRKGAWRWWALPAALLLLPALHAPAAAQPAAPDTARLVGQVVSALDGRPLPGAVVSLLRSAMGAITDSAGNFAIPRTAAGQDTVEVRYVGYERNLMPLYLEPERTTRVVLLLSPNVVRLADLKVEVERERLDILRGFDERRAKGIGHYFTFEEIQKRKPRYTSDLLRQVPGLRVGPSISGRAEITSGRSAIACTPAVFLDGIQYRGLHVDDVLATDLGGVEVYTGAAQVPPQFATAAAASGCGVIVIWTRRGFQRSGGCGAAAPRRGTPSSARAAYALVGDGRAGGPSPSGIARRIPHCIGARGRASTSTPIEIWFPPCATTGGALIVTLLGKPPV